ncbi:unnamed protein product [Cercopithifilaria johnstoni]|uniref:Uncharacterized protein n=1 Tax=Cercopithifilaria johnstoni TaxID=2874296 RepID=A0A8J2MJ97_9BILA|nr:unnamed protein product [Cercopithifilaria johnstoni]
MFIKHLKSYREERKEWCPSLMPPISSCMHVETPCKQAAIKIDGWMDGETIGLIDKIKLTEEEEEKDEFDGLQAVLRSKLTAAM